MSILYSHVLQNFSLLPNSILPTDLLFLYDCHHHHHCHVHERVQEDFLALSTLKMEILWRIETSVTVWHLTQRHIPWHLISSSTGQRTLNLAMADTYNHHLDINCEKKSCGVVISNPASCAQNIALQRVFKESLHWHTYHVFSCSDVRKLP